MFSLFDWGMCKKNQNMASGNLMRQADLPGPGFLDTSLSNALKKRKRGDSEGPLGAGGKTKMGKMLPSFTNTMSASDVPLQHCPGQQYAYPPSYGTPVRSNDSPSGTEWKKADVVDFHDHPTLPSPPITIPEQANGTPAENLVPAMDPAMLTSLQQTIEAQFSVEILLKHNELRLIDQELAKCQVALEQLRRCQAIPYPAFGSNFDEMDAVSRGVGPTSRSRGGGKEAEQPPPWGVTDGPYSRHYAKWLLPDPLFDGGVVEELPRRHAGQALPERATRGGKGERGIAVNGGRGQRGLAGSRLQSLPAGYPEPKEEKGPMILKRSSDGKMVKLVCLDCRRENFNSAQGFINHCRIAHGRGFQSHDAAALACGEELEYNEAGAVVSEPHAPVSTGIVGLVHPLIRSAHPAAVAQTPVSASSARQRKANTKLDSGNRVPDSSGQVPNAAIQSRQSKVVEADKFSHVPFVPSPIAPHLSALFEKAGRGGDLGEFVSEAKTKADFDNIASDDDEDVGDNEMGDAGSIASSTPVNSSIQIRGGRLPAHTIMSPTPSTRPISSKGLDRPRSRRPEHLSNISQHPNYASPFSLSGSSPHDMHMVSTPTEQNTTMLLPSHTPHDLSPATTETHPAPSLVSDDEDDEYAGSNSDSDSHSSNGEDDVDDRYVEVEVEDEVEVGGPSVDPELRTSGKARAHGSRPTGSGNVLSSEGTIRSTESRQGGRRERRRRDA